MQKVSYKVIDTSYAYLFPEIIMKNETGELLSITNSGDFIIKNDDGKVDMLNKQQLIFLKFIK